jgi:hypothetical protein
VRAHVEAQYGRIMIDYRSAYAPDMNPVECIWGYLTHHARKCGNLAGIGRVSFASGNASAVLGVGDIPRHKDRG